MSVVSHATLMQLTESLEHDVRGELEDGIGRVEHDCEQTVLCADHSC